MLAFEVLPKLQVGAQSQELAQAFAAHLEQTRAHAARLEDLFARAGVETSSTRDPVAARLFEHADAAAASVVEPRLRDVFHATSAAKTEHYEIAVYDALIRLADLLGLDAAPLEQSRSEEVDALERVESVGARIAKELP